MIEKRIESDLKAALLGGDKKKTEILRVLKSALLYEAVALNKKDEGLDDEQIQKVLARESKKRAEAADLYKNAGEQERAEAELAEKAVIDSYLPAQLSEAEVKAIVDEELAKIDNPTPADMGKVIGAVRAKTGAQAEGSTIARLVKSSLESR
ncbi:MAG TPA: GatB/YqeY domain-containing protein [Candidatus Saccharimonadales bacterium]|nr:GatB/YqeY domain-containing protein [Candidatus Saccharimonadales bacterium]